MPLLAMLLADVLLLALLPPDYPSFSALTPWVYGSFLLYVALGRLAARLERHLGPVSVLFGAVAGSVQFFLITNFAAWLGDALYPPTFAGLVQCYVAGLPFVRNTLLGDLFYTGVLFGLYHAAVWAWAKGNQHHEVCGDYRVHSGLGKGPSSPAGPSPVSDGLVAGGEVSGVRPVH
jgi:hypothetical protein